MAIFSESTPLSIRSIFILCLAILIPLTVFEPKALASPLSTTTSEPNRLSKRYTGQLTGPRDDKPGPDDRNYPSDDEIRAAYISSNGPTVFYSNIGNPQPAADFAASIGGLLLKDSFPEGYTLYNGRKAKWFQDFVDRASGILSDQASGEVFFVSRWDNVVDPCRVWARIEYPSLIVNEAVTKITQVDYTNFDNKREYASPQAGSKLKRDDAGYCFDWDGDREDPLGPATDPNLDLPYYPGNCGAHIVQYQKTEKKTNPGSTYRLDITLKDDQGELVGEMLFADAPAGQTINVDGNLPVVFIANAQNVDTDPLQFSVDWEGDCVTCSGRVSVIRIGLADLRRVSVVQIGLAEVAGDQAGKETGAED